MWTAAFNAPPKCCTKLAGLSRPSAWESEGMVRRYAHLAPAQLVQHAEVISKVLGDTTATQAENEPEADGL